MTTRTTDDKILIVLCRESMTDELRGLFRELTDRGYRVIYSAR